MTRFVLLFSALSAAMAGGAMAQTVLSDRPGLWISVPRTEAPVVAAPAAEAAILEAPASGPLIPTDPAPSVILEAPETAALIAPPPAPGTRPVPRPREIIAAVAPEGAVVEAAADGGLPPAVATPAEVAVVAEVPGPVEAEAPAEVIPTAEIDAAPAAPPVVATAPEVQPRPRPETAETVALAEALAAQIAGQAEAIMVAAPRNVPRAEGIAPEEALPPARAVPAVSVVPAVVAPEAAIRSPAPIRTLTPPDVVPLLATGFMPAARGDLPMVMSAVLLPSRAASARPVAQPVAFIVPPRENAPILPRLHPSGPVAQEAVAPPGSARPAPLSAVLLPSTATPVAPLPHFARAPLPAADRFPMSALPPSALEPGPDSLTRTIQPPRPFAEANAAVLTGAPPVTLVRMPVLAPSATPAFDTPVTDPDAAVELPSADPGAIARMMDDVMICWRLADLGVEAQWARLSVDVALDETNLPSADSIRLTGFARVVSGAAEEAYRAAHAALMGCGAATAAAPATASETLVFDRSGVHLQ